MAISRGRRAAPLPEQGAPRRVRVRLEHIRRVECVIVIMPFHGEHVTADMPGWKEMPFEGEHVPADMPVWTGKCEHALRRGKCGCRGPTGL